MTPARCPYFAYQAEADPADPSFPSSAIKILSYCRHKHSPATPSEVLFSEGGADLLKCGGDLGKCQVPSHLRLDGQWLKA